MPEVVDPDEEVVPGGAGSPVLGPTTDDPLGGAEAFPSSSGGALGGGGDEPSVYMPSCLVITHPLCDENILKNNTTLYEIKTSFKARSNQ